MERWRLVVAATAVALVALAGCVPSETGGFREVDDGSDSARPEVEPPVFPEGGSVPDELVVEGVAFDLSNRPRDLAFWALPTDEAACAAELIVDGVGGGRLASLGYRPGVVGASLNSLDLTDDERQVVIAAVKECADLAEGIAAIFYGDGRMAPTVANCLADGLDEAGQLDPFVRALAFGTSVDPFAQDAALADALIDQAVVCVPANAFNWPAIDPPGGPTVIDQNAPPGVEGSPFVDDNPATSTPGEPGSDGDGDG